MRFLWLAATLALMAASPVHESDPAAEQSVRSWLAAQSLPRASEAPAGFSTEDRRQLKDSVAAARPALRDMPGLSPEPFDVCRTLERCWPLPTSFHVESQPLIADAVTALLRPWIVLGKARGWTFSFSPVPAGAAILTARLDGLPQERLEIASAAVPTGGYDVWLNGADGAPALFERERALTLGER